MKKITKTQRAKIDDALMECLLKSRTVETAVEEYNDGVAPLKEKLEEAITEFNEKILNLRLIYEEIGEEARSYYDERSEKWQESDAGVTYNEWVEKLEYPEDMEGIEIEFPDEIQSPEIPDFEDDGWLPPDEPEGE